MTIVNWYYSLELHEAMALAYSVAFLSFFGVGFFILELKEKKLAREESKLFQDEDGIPRFVRASDQQIGLHNH